jgi:hypothetical protein
MQLFAKGGMAFLLPRYQILFTIQLGRATAPYPVRYITVTAPDNVTSFSPKE